MAATLAACTPALARPVASRVTTRAMACGPRMAAYRWKPLLRQARMSPDAWASSCNTDSWQQWQQAWNSMAREMQEGVTDLTDSNQNSVWAQQRRAANMAGRTRPLPFDVLETPDAVMLMFDLPGVARRDVQLKVSDEGVLSVAVDRQPPQTVDADVPVTTPTDPAPEGGAKEKEDKQQTQTVVRMERPYGSFRRSIRLPKTVNGEAISAKLAEGVLTVTLPKFAKEEPASINISVE